MSVLRLSSGCARLLWFAAGAALRPSFVHADAVLFGTGYGNFRQGGATAVFLRYQTQAPTVLGHASLYELSVGAWNGPNRNAVVALARGIRWRWSPKIYLGAELGIGAVMQTTDHLGTHLQFVSHVVVGRQFGRYDLTLGETHYSNAKDLFHWSGPNVGENFLTLELGRDF
jgi:Lipid A 3-O-deacylase (PagL)